MIFSNILEKVLRIEIGLKLERSVLSPDLYIGITFATLRSSGKTPVSNDLLIIYTSQDTVYTVYTRRAKLGQIQGGGCRGPSKIRQRGGLQ